MREVSKRHPGFPAIREQEGMAGKRRTMEKTVNDMKIGEQAVVTGLGCSGALRRRIIDMGITPGAVIIMRKAAPMGDPLEINVRGYELSIRRSEAKEITVLSEGGTGTADGAADSPNTAPGSGGRWFARRRRQDGGRERP